MAVVPLRQPAGEEPPAPKPREQPTVRIEVDDDGLKTISIGGSGTSGDRKRHQPATDDFDRNLAEDLDDTALAALASYLLESIRADGEGRSKWEETVNKGARYLGIELNDPLSEPAADGTVYQGVSTALLEANIKLWSTAYAELLPVGGPVKVERQDTPKPKPAPGIGHNGGPGMDGSEPGQAPDDQGDQVGDDDAQALEKDLNWYLTVGDRGYYLDFSAMLMMRDRIGVAFREVFKCPIARKPLSRWIMAQDFIIKGNPAHLNDAERVTVRKKISQSRMRRMMVSGEYLDIALVAPTGQVSATEIVIGESQGISQPSLPRDFDHTIYESNCELGSGTTHDNIGPLEILDQDEKGNVPGYPLPYRVTIDEDSQVVLSIRRNWKKGDPDHRRKRRYVKYGFIPADGFYDWGLLHIAGNPTQGATMLLRSGVDASVLANFPAWMMAQGPASRLEETSWRPGPGEVVKIPTTAGEKLDDKVKPWPYKEASPQSMELGQKLEGDVKSIAGVVDLPIGEGRIGNTPVGTIMSYIESVSMVPGAVHKADHIAQAEEFELLRELIAEEPEVLWRDNPTPARKWQVRDELMSPNLAPKADPNTPSQMHRLLKIQGLISMGGLPQFEADAQGPIANNRAIYKRAAEVLTGEDAAEFMYPPQPPAAAPPPPDPRVVAAQIKAQSEKEKGQQKQQESELEHAARMEELRQESSDKAADREAADRREAMKAHQAVQKTGADMVSDAVGHAQDEAAGHADRQHQAGLAAQAQQHDKQQQSAEHAQQLTAPFLAPPDQGKPDAT